MNTIIFLGATLMQRLVLWNVILGICLIVVGVLFFVFSKRFAMIKHNKDEVDSNNSTVIIFRTIGFVLLIAGMIFMIIQ